MGPILEIRNLVKHFKKVKAVNGISFSIPTGICFGLLGPNGAGKTTTIEMIEGITYPTAGEILYKGEPVGSRLTQEAGIQFQSTALMDFLTVDDLLNLFSSLYPKAVSKQKLIEQCRLGEFLNQQAAKLSGGQRQRVLLAIALINDPAIVFLDEPTTGLDPQARQNFWELIRHVKAEGKTIVLTTHYMDEAQQLCDRLVIVDHGKVIAESSPQKLLKMNFDHVFVYLDSEGIDRALLEASDSIVNVEHGDDGDRWVIKTSSVEHTLQSLIDKGVPLNSLQVRTPSLDDLFLKLTGHSLRE
ncbi:MAG: ABC transporter ATP-binding protein [Exilibacterium sp.]